jgi:hypothetical protein
MEVNGVYGRENDIGEKQSKKKIEVLRQPDMFPSIPQFGMAKFESHDEFDRLLMFTIQQHSPILSTLNKYSIHQSN